MLLGYGVFLVVIYDHLHVLLVYFTRHYFHVQVPLVMVTVNDAFLVILCFFFLYMLVLCNGFFIIIVIIFKAPSNNMQFLVMFPSMTLHKM